MKISNDMIYSLLDCEAVLIPIQSGSKAPKEGLGKWQNFTYKKTLTDSYQKTLTNAPAIGVVLHTERTTLCSIDIDHDGLLKVFLAQNPKLENTLRTKGKKGGNIWLKLKGKYPEYKALKHEGEPAGEWRVGNHYTIITGKHPDGMSYRVIERKPVLEIDFSEINWTGFYPLSKPCPIDSIDTTDGKDTIDYTDATDYTEERREKKEKTTLVEKIKAATKARAELK